MIPVGDRHGVLAATWPNQHRKQSERCLAAGTRSILCEAARALTGDDAVHKRETVDKANAFLMEVFRCRHHSAARKPDELLRSGAIVIVQNLGGSAGHKPHQETPR